MGGQEQGSSRIRIGMQAMAQQQRPAGKPRHQPVARVRVLQGCWNPSFAFKTRQDWTRLWLREMAVDWSKVETSVRMRRAMFKPGGHLQQTNSAGGSAGGSLRVLVCKIV